MGRPSVRRNESAPQMTAWHRRMAHDSRAGNNVSGHILAFIYLPTHQKHAARVVRVSVQRVFGVTARPLYPFCQARGSVCVRARVCGVSERALGQTRNREPLGFRAIIVMTPPGATMPYFLLYVE